MPLATSMAEPICYTKSANGSTPISRRSDRNSRSRYSSVTISTAVRILHWSFSAGAAAALLSLALAIFALPTILSLPGIVVLGAIAGSSLSQRVSRQQPQAG